MAFQGNFTCNIFKVGLLDGFYNFNSFTTTDVFKIALYTNAATLNATTSDYVNNTTGEVVASGYTAGGQVLTIAQNPTIGNQTGAATSYISFDNAVWTGAITARGALIYKSNGVTPFAVCVLDFGADKTSTTTFTVQFPAVTNTSAIIRIS